MTTEHYLWAIFALLWIALVLVIVTARRGPWEREHHQHVHVPFDGVRLLDSGVDPLWGKNRLEES